MPAPLSSSMRCQYLEHVLLRYLFHDGAISCGCSLLVEWQSFCLRYMEKLWHMLRLIDVVRCGHYGGMTVLMAWTMAMVWRWD
ncbi:hypothetical protein M0R45_009510 [Rubus argutus]|uniref:Uncharacterized protein n=1 Tax=Rubus argutus TaxID=59490 RepID=A0AAW1Y785_RUBAR